MTFLFNKQVHIYIFRCKFFNKNACAKYAQDDQRTNDGIIAKKVICVLLYSLGKVSYNMLAHIFDTWPSLVYRWIAQAGAQLPDPEVSGDQRDGV